MNFTIDHAVYSPCGHLNFFFENGRQVTLHTSDLEDIDSEITPEMVDAILKTLIKLKMRPVLQDQTKTQAQKLQIIKNAIKGGVSVWP